MPSTIGNALRQNFAVRCDNALQYPAGEWEWDVAVAYDAIELEALSEDLDADVVTALGPGTKQISAASYARAYRKVGRRPDRERQICLISHLGGSLDSLARQLLIGVALRMLHKPAELAGFGGLYSFIERGYAAFRKMRDSGKFLTIVADREMGAAGGGGVSGGGGGTAVTEVQGSKFKVQG